MFMSSTSRIRFEKILFLFFVSSLFIGYHFAMDVVSLARKLCSRKVIDVFHFHTPAYTLNIVFDSNKNAKAVRNAIFRSGYIRARDT